MLQENTLKLTSGRPKVLYKNGLIKDKGYVSAYEMIAFFSANPEEELNTRDMMTKFELRTAADVYGRTKMLLVGGWLEKKKEFDPLEWRPGLKINVYTAGPRIRRLHGMD